MKHAHEPFFPVQTETRDASHALFTNTVIGGVSRLDYFALTIFAGLMANPAYIAAKMTSEKLRECAIDQAAKLISELKERQSGS